MYINLVRVHIGFMNWANLHLQSFYQFSTLLTGTNSSVFQKAHPTFPTQHRELNPVRTERSSNISNGQERTSCHFLYSLHINNRIQTFHGAKGSKDRRNPVAQTTASTPRTASTSLSAPSVTSAVTFSHTTTPIRTTITTTDQLKLAHLTRTATQAEQLKTHESKVGVRGQAAARPLQVRGPGDDAESLREQLLHDALAGAPRRAGHEDGRRLLLGGRRARRGRVHGGGGPGAEEELSCGGCREREGYGGV